MKIQISRITYTIIRTLNLETNYSISLNVSVVDWRFVSENILESINFGLVTNVAESTLDFGSIT